MEVENMKFGLLLAAGVLFLMFVFFASYYTLYEISNNQNLNKSRKYLWATATLLFPAIGPFSYFLLVKKAEYAGGNQR